MRYFINIMSIIMMFVITSCGGIGKGISYNHEFLRLEGGRFVYRGMYESGKVDVSEIQIKLDNGEFLVGRVIVEYGVLYDIVRVEDIKISRVYHKSLIGNRGKEYEIERIVMRDVDHIGGIWVHHFIRYIEVEIGGEIDKIITRNSL